MIPRARGRESATGTAGLVGPGTWLVSHVSPVGYNIERVEQTLAGRCDLAIGFAASQGNFELNVFNPVTIHNFLHSVTVLRATMRSFADYCLTGEQFDQ